MTAYEDLKNIELVGKQIIDGIKEYKKTAARPSCDKHNMGFNKDERFSSVKINLSIDAYAGFYGNSSCSRISLVRDKHLFKKFFLETLNGRFEELMFETADRLSKHSDTKKAEAIEELEASLLALKEE